MITPILMIFAGPNGSGKSTVTSAEYIYGEYVNADEIQAQLRCSAEEAAIIAENSRKNLLKERRSFTFETVLSTTRNLELAALAKQAGYHVICIYVLTVDPAINLQRVAARKRNGGHDVPPDKVVPRYRRAMKLFPNLFSICDELYVFDNSLDRSEGTPELIVSWQNGIRELFPTPLWTMEKLQALCDGTYAMEES